jgi:hypothetical protein
VRDWDTFGQYMRKGRERVQQAKAEDLRLRNLGERVAPDGLGFYNPDATTKLADLVGRSNVGVRYRPYLGAALSARLWLQNQKNKAKSEKDQAMWNRWDIVEADLDNDKTTPDNVVTFSDRARGKIKAVDRYELMSKTSKEINRTFYSNFPNPRDRHRIDDKIRRELRSWYRKYP